MHHQEELCTHFCSEWCTVNYDKPSIQTGKVGLHIDHISLRFIPDGLNWKDNTWTLLQIMAWCQLIRTIEDLVNWRIASLSTDGFQIMTVMPKFFFLFRWWAPSLKKMMWISSWSLFWTIDCIYVVDSYLFVCSVLLIDGNNIWPVFLLNGFVDIIEHLHHCRHGGNAIRIYVGKKSAWYKSLTSMHSNLSETKAVRCNSAQV